MRTMLSISLALALVLTCEISAGQRIWVEAPEDCGEWLKARKLKRSSPYEAHLVGLLSGMAIGRMIDIWKAHGNPAKSGTDHGFVMPFSLAPQLNG